MISWPLRQFYDPEQDGKIIVERRYQVLDDGGVIEPDKKDCLISDPPPSSSSSVVLPITPLSQN